jgi:hypothetical protein
MSDSSSDEGDAPALLQKGSSAASNNANDSNNNDSENDSSDAANDDDASADEASDSDQSDALLEVRIVFILYYFLFEVQCCCCCMQAPISAIQTVTGVSRKHEDVCMRRP